MIRKHHGAISWLEFEILSGIPGILHAIFLRNGGISQGCYHSLNLAQTGRDIPSHVEENLSRAKKILGIRELLSARQIHSQIVKNVDHPIDKGKKLFLDCDGLMTNKKQRALMINHADCQAAIFYDPRQGAIAVVHAGWRGQVKNIYQETILGLRDLYGSYPEDLIVAISPSLGPENSEFKHYREEFPSDFWPFQTKPNYFNLWNIARSQLQMCGVRPSHIQIAEIDTYAHPEDFFSYRREKALGRTHHITGGHGTIVMLS